MLSSGSDQIMLAQRFADFDAARGEEGVGHSAADDQMIDLADQVAEHVELGRDLGAADHRRDRALGIAQRLLQRVQLGLHRPPGERRQQVATPSVEAWARCAAEKASLT